MAEESRDGQEGPSPCSTYEEASTRCPSVQAVSAPSSPPGTQPGPVPGLGPDSASLQKAGERPSSLPPSSPRALTNNDWAYHSPVCPAECQHPGMQIVKGIHTDTRRLTCSPAIQILFHVQVYCRICRLNTIGCSHLYPQHVDYFGEKERKITLCLQEPPSH